MAVVKRLHDYGDLVFEVLKLDADTCQNKELYSRLMVKIPNEFDSFPEYVEYFKPCILDNSRASVAKCFSPSFTGLKTATVTKPMKINLYEYKHNQNERQLWTYPLESLAIKAVNSNYRVEVQHGSMCVWVRNDLIKNKRIKTFPTNALHPNGHFFCLLELEGARSVSGVGAVEVAGPAVKFVRGKAQDSFVHKPHEWTLFLLNVSLVPARRVMSAFVQPEKFDRNGALLHQIFKGRKQETGTAATTECDEEKVKAAMEHLSAYLAVGEANASQNRFAEQILRKIYTPESCMFHDMQGPPGATKTSTVVALAKLVAKHSEENVYLTAPANLSVRSLALGLAEGEGRVPLNQLVLMGNEFRLKIADSEVLRTVHLYSRVALLKQTFADLGHRVDCALDLLACPQDVTNADGAQVLPGLLDDCIGLCHHLIEYGSAAVRACVQSGPNSNSADGDLSLSLIQALGQVVATEGETAIADWFRFQQGGVPPARERFSAEQHMRMDDHMSLLYSALTRFRSTAARDSQNIWNKVCEDLLSEARVVVSTVSTAGSKLRQKALKLCRLVIVDEASLLEEASLPIVISGRPDQLLVVAGDEKQLGVVVVSEQAQRCGYGRGVQQRLTALCKQNGVVRCADSYSRLDVQYRMDCNISHLCIDLFYDWLQNGDNVKDPAYSERFRGLAGVSFYDLRGPEVCWKSSLKNRVEANAMINYLVEMHEEFQAAMNTAAAGNEAAATTRGDDSGPPPPRISVTIIAAYSLQKEHMQFRLQKFKKEEWGKVFDLRCVTIDEYQGQECDVVLLSTVRSKTGATTEAAGVSAKQKDIGFLADWRRLNVAITRARHALVIFGNATTLSYCPHWRALIDAIRQSASSGSHRTVFESWESLHHGPATPAVPAVTSDPAVTAPAEPSRYTKAVRVAASNNLKGHADRQDDEVVVRAWHDLRCGAHFGDADQADQWFCGDYGETEQQQENGLPGPPPSSSSINSINSVNSSSSNGEAQGGDGRSGVEQVGDRVACEDDGGASMDAGDDDDDADG